LSYSLPQYAPLFGRPPYHYRGYRKLSAVCRADRAALAAALPAPLTLESDLVEVFAMDVPDAGALGSYREGGVVVKASYGGRTGGHVLYEYVTSDDSMAAGREIWGYPKKLCEIDWVEDGQGGVSASVTRRGHEVIGMRFQDGGADYRRLDLQPRFQVKRIPAADGEGNDIDRVIRNELKGGTVHQRRTGTASVRLGGPAQDPLGELGVSEVIGAEFIVADFILEFGKILD
jgi:acetoacetate decarboxylase